jgi:hypothetical protein
MYIEGPELDAVPLKKSPTRQCDMVHGVVAQACGDHCTHVTAVGGSLKPYDVKKTRGDARFVGSTARYQLVQARRARRGGAGHEVSHRAGPPIEHRARDGDGRRLSPIAIL